MSTKPKSLPRLFTDLEGLYPQGLELPSPPQFPSFQALVDEDLKASQTPATLSKKLNDLFDGFLGTLDPLLADYQASPEKYGVETHDLLEQLIHGTKSLEQLSTIERHYLNLATFDFFGVAKPKAEPPRRPVTEPADEEAEQEAEDEADEYEKTAGQDAKKPEAPIPGVDVPVTELPAYWWLQ